MELRLAFNSLCSWRWFSPPALISTCWDFMCQQAQCIFFILTKCILVFHGGKFWERLQVSPCVYYEWCKTISDNNFYRAFNHSVTVALEILPSKCYTELPHSSIPVNRESNFKGRENQPPAPRHSSIEPANKPICINYRSAFPNFMKPLAAMLKTKLYKIHLGNPRNKQILLK